MKWIIVCSFVTAIAFGATTPKKTCNALAEAARDNDHQAYIRLTLGSRALASKNYGKKGFERMHKGQEAKLKNLKCGEELIAGDKAVVKATTRKGSRLIPFVLQAKDWKFDSQSYRTTYRRTAKP